MKIVDLYKMSEEERKKALEEQQSMYNERMQQSDEIRRQANQQFNNLVSKQGEYDTTKHTTTIGELRNAYRNSSNYEAFNNSLNNYYNKNKNNPSIWERVQNISNFNNNSRLMLNNNNSTDYRQAILNAGNRNKILEQETKKDKDILETINNKNNTAKLFNEGDKQIIPLKENSEDKEKNKNILEDTGSLAKLVGLGVSTGGKEVLNYIESSNENNFGEVYKDLRRRQFLTSQKVNEKDKAIAKTQDNLLLKSKGIKIDDETQIETNLVKKAIRDSINKDNEVIQEEQNKISNQGMQTLGKIAPSMGQMLPGMALNAVNPILGMTYFTTSAGGGYIDDALNRGMNEQQAFKYGTVMGALEGASESIITGQQLSKVKKAFTGKEISKKLLNSYGFNIFENAVQEAVMEPAQEITAGIVGDKADWSNMGSRMLESGFNGALMGAISNGVTFGLEKSGNVYNKIKNGESITEAEYKEALQENIDKFGKDAVENAMKKGATEVYQEINNLQQQSTQSEQILPTQQITQEQNNVAQNENMEQVLPTQKYYYEKSDNVKIDNLRQDVNKYFDNSEKTHNFVNMLEKIIEDKDIEIRLDENLTDANGNMANGKYENGTITINPNSNRAGEFIAIHELTHAIGTDSMRNIIENYRKSNTEFDNAVKSLLENYNTTELTDEAMADVSAQLFGNQEYINNLAQTNPSLFTKIYNEIKYLWHQFTGYKNQNQFLEDLQYKWEQAYKNNNELNETANYYIQPLEEFNEKMYNNTKGLKLNSKEEYALREIVNSDSNVKPGINKVETTNATYTIYFKDIDDFKVITRKVDKNAGKLNKRDDYTGGKARYSLPYSESNGNKTTTRSNDEISTINKTRESERIGSVTSGSDNIRNSIENSNKSSFSMDNKGRMLTKEQQEYFRDSKARDEDGNLKTVYHTTTDTGEQFNEFNPVGTPGYRFGEQIVNYYTDSKEMSGSYADGKYEMADTKKFTNIDDAEKWLKGQNSALDNFSIEKQGEYYVVKSNDRPLGNVYFENKADLLKNLKEKFNKYRQNFGYNNQSRFQYEGYANITNPYIIDAKGSNWNQIENGIVEYGEKLIKELNTLKENKLDYKIRRTFDKAYFNSKKAMEDYLSYTKKMTSVQNDIADAYARDGNNNFLYETPLYNDNDRLEFKKHENDKIEGKTLKEIGLDYYNNKYEKIIENQINELKANNPILKDFSMEDLDMLYEMDMDESRLKYRFKKRVTTNDIVNDIIKQNNNGSNYDGVIIKNVVDYGGNSENRNPANLYITFNSNQFKNTDNVNPTENPDIRYSKNNQNWQEYLDKNIEPKGTRTNLQEIKVPTKRKILPVKEKNINEQSKITPFKEASNEASINLSESNTPVPPTKGETIDWGEIERPEGKIRKHYRSIIESSNTTAEAKAIAKEMMGTDTYIPESNKSQIERADAYIEEYGVEDALDRIEKHIKNDEITYDNKGLLDTLRRKKVSVDDIALGERLIQYYSKTGDAKHLQDAIHYTAIMGTEAGRAVQVMALLNHMTPQGQLTWLDRSITKMNDELKNKNKNKSNTPQFEITQEMKEKILNTKSTEEMYDVIDEIYEELGQQVPKSKLEQIDEWRYFSMLANIKTHGRNIIGNVAMHFTQRAKDKVAGAIEGTVAKFNPEMERTHTLRRVSEEVKQFAENDLKNRDVQTQLGMNEDKYNPQSRLQKARKTFKNDLLNNTLGKAFKGNSTLLEVEDNLFLKPMYKKALGEYITANKIDVNKITDAQLSKARKYAVQQAKEATFHQESVLATTLNQLGKRSNLAKFALDAAVPFKKTPINVAKTGIQYSPVGIMTTALYDTYQLKKGNISVNKYIDNISKGLTGTGITFLGYALAEAGILKASGSDDDRKEKYEEEQGKQTYSIEIGGKTYSLDWLSPVGVPLFIGVETNQQFKNKKKEKNSKSTDDENDLSQILKGVSNVVSASSKAVNPISEMSMISGLTNILSSFNKENAWANMALNAGKSYVNQFVPTALGQIARTTDDYERSTKSTKTDPFEKAVDSTFNQIKSKIPGLRQTLPTKTDIWGKDIKQDANLPFRAFNNFINPAKVQDVSTDKVDKELNSLYAKTGESSIIPKAIEKTYTIDGTTYRMTDNEYAKYYKKYGETSYNLINELISSKDYKDLTNEQKQKAIEEIYSYANKKNKRDYAKNNNVKIEEKSAIYDTLEELKSSKNQINYLNYLAKTNDIQGEEANKKKLAILNDSNYSDSTKNIIYKNTLGKNDKTYDSLSKITNLNINAYMNYKLQDIKGDEDTNSNVKGKTVSGSKKENVYNYLSNSNLSTVERLYIYGTSYKLDNQGRTILQEAINSSNLSQDEKLEIYGRLTANVEKYKDGTYHWK